MTRRIPLYLTDDEALRLRRFLEEREAGIRSASGAWRPSERAMALTEFASISEKLEEAIDAANPKPKSNNLLRRGDYYVVRFKLENERRERVMTAQYLDEREGMTYWSLRPLAGTQDMPNSCLVEVTAALDPEPKLPTQI